MKRLIMAGFLALALAWMNKDGGENRPFPYGQSSRLFSPIVPFLDGDLFLSQRTKRPQ